MPSRLFILVIVSFWLATTGWFVAREVAPRWRSGDAPPYAIELADEALKSPVPIKWRLVWNGRSGRLPILWRPYSELHRGTTGRDQTLAR